MISLIFLSILTTAWAQECPDVNKAPLCPNSGSTLLDDTYPTQAFVVSTEGFHTQKKGKLSTNNYLETNIQMPAKFITNIMLSYSKDYPDILVPTYEDDFAELKLAVTKNLKEANVPQKEIDLQLAKIKIVDAHPYTWQQDFFESFVNLETGKPDLRSITSYDKAPMSSQAYTSLIAKSVNCGTEGKGLAKKKLSGTEVGGVTKSSANPKLLSGEYSWGNGEMGGNIEGLPGGLCLKANNQASSFVKEYCGSESNFVEIDVGWLEVGHSDELVKVVPTFPKGSPAECSFSIMVASPDAAMETLKDSDYANRPFIELGTKDPETIKNKIKDVVGSKAGKRLCQVLKDNYIVPGKDGAKKDGASQAFMKILSQFSLDAHAGSGSASGFSCEAALKDISNRKMLDLLSKDEDFVETNRLVQEKMNKAKADMEAKLKERMPQCKNVNFINAPNLFYNDVFAEIDGSKVLPQPGRAGSLFPNPTNAVLANETLIISETPSFALNDKLSKMLKQNGLKSSFVDTWNYAHKGDGNLHCSSHSIPYCQPRGKQ